MLPLFLLWSLLKLHCESVSRSVSVFPVALESTFEATCPQAPFYHPPASALTTSLSRTLPEVSGLALSPLSARGTACDSEKENSSGSTDAVVSQVHYGTWRIRAQPVWVPHWTQRGANQHWLDTEGLVVSLLCSACLSRLDFLLALSRDLSRGAEVTNSNSSKSFCTGL